MSLADAGVILLDCDHKTPEAVDFGRPYVGIPQMTSGRIDFSTARRITEADFITWTRKTKYQKDDVVLSRRTNPGVTAVDDTGIEFALGQNLVLLRANGRSVYPPFLRWLVRGPEWWFQIEKFINVGAVFSSLRCRDVPNFELTIPPLPEQRAIAATLGALDDKIELSRRMNATLESMARALFRDWFVDFGPTRAKMEGGKPYLSPDLWSLFPDRLDDEGKPEGWEMRRIDQLLELAYGKALKATDRQPGNIRVYGSGGVTGTHSEALVSGPSIIVGRKGTVGSLYWEDDPFWPIDTVFYVRPFVPLTFCYSMLEQMGLDHMNTDAAVPGLNRNNVYRLETAWPGEKLVRAFDEFSSAIRARVKHNNNESRTLARTRDLLLPRLMSGELRVAEAETLASEVA